MKTDRRIPAVILILTMIFGTSRYTRADPPQLWLYYSTNLLVDANIDQLQRVWRQAAADGYTHILFSDSKLARLDDLGSIENHYFQNLQRTRQIATQLGLQIVPSLFQIGYSNDILFNNPSLAEGLPVRDVSFVVHSQTAQVVFDPTAALPERPTWHDPSVNIYGLMAINGLMATVENNPNNARLVFSKTLIPFHCYHIQVWIRTQDYTGEPQILVLASNNMNLQYESLGVRRSQPWQRYDVVFDTLNNTRVNIYFGVWGGAKGTLQWRNWKMELAGLVNPLSRPGAPTTIEGYEQGKDYAPISDPNCGTRPYPGEYQSWHNPVNIQFLRPIPDGTIVRVSWFYPPIFYDGQVSADLGDPSFRQLLAHEAQLVRTALPSAGYMMSFDEIRVLGWDDAEQQTNETPGQELADAAHYCTGLLDGATAYTWSDMFDPYHNAHNNYYLVNGDLSGSWKGLEPQIVIFNWNSEHCRESLNFFSNLGHQQIIAGYYDGPLSDLAAWMAAARGVPGIIGYMYTTWRGDYSKIDTFARMVRQNN